MTAQLVQDLPVLFSKSLNISADDVIIVSITRSNNNNSKQQKRAVSENDSAGIIITMAIPETQVHPFENLIADTKSPLYSADNGQLPKFIDPSYPVQNKAGKVAITLMRKKKNEKNSPYVK
jgi:hypothetical protein